MKRKLPRLYKHIEKSMSDEQLAYGGTCRGTQERNAREGDGELPRLEDEQGDGQESDEEANASSSDATQESNEAAAKQAVAWSA